MKKTVQVLGETLTIAFNLAVQIAYEDITDAPFNVADLQKRKNMLALYFAAIIANNPETEITIDRLMQDATLDDIQALDTAIGECMQAWFKISMQKEEKTEGKGKPTKRSRTV